MPKLTSRILVINDEHLVLREFVKGLNSAARTLDNPLGISFTGVTTAKEALSVIESDRDLQSVLVDDRLQPGQERLQFKEETADVGARAGAADHPLPARARRLHPDRAGEGGRRRRQ